jgi:DNA-binding beta-propeller fold protein YncE
MGRLARVMRWLGVAVLAALAVVLIVLVFPGRPRSSGDLRFVGFVPLPKTGAALLSALDYMNIADGRLYVASISNGAVYRVPLPAVGLPDPRTIAIIAGAGAAHSAVIDPVSRRLFISRSGVDEVDVVDPATLVTIRRIRVPADVDGMIYDPAARLIYAESAGPERASLIDPATLTLVATIPLGGEPEFPAFDPVTGLIYQNITSANAVAAVDLARRRVIQTWPLAGCVRPTGAAIDAPDRRLFVVCGGASRLLAIDLATRHVVASLPIGGGPDAVAYDPQLRRIYATGLAGVLTVVRQDGPDRYRLTSRIPLHFGAHTLAVDPTTHRVYVGYASLLLPPRLAVFDAVDRRGAGA